jgi:hypothetical protein
VALGSAIQPSDARESAGSRNRSRRKGAPRTPPTNVCGRRARRSGSRGLEVRRPRAGLELPVLLDAHAEFPRCPSNRPARLLAIMLEHAGERRHEGSLASFLVSLPYYPWRVFCRGGLPDSWRDIEARSSAIRKATFGASLDPERRMRQRLVCAHDRSRRKREIEDAMKTWFTGCAQCGALTTNAEGYCPDCEAARLARRREGRMSQTRILAANVRRSSSDRR